MSGHVHLELALPLDWDRIEPIRRSVALAVSAVFGADELGASLAMVSAELLENAVKYGTREAPVRLTVHEEGGEVTIVVKNQVPPGSPHAAVLRERLAWLATFATTEEAYMAALERAYDSASDGGLGIVRIAHEGHCRLALQATAPGEVIVRATRATEVDARAARASA